MSGMAGNIGESTPHGLFDFYSGFPVSILI